MEGPGQPVEGLFLGSAVFPGFRLAFAKGLRGRFATVILPGICRTATSVFMIFVYFEGLADMWCGRRGSWIPQIGQILLPTL